MGERRRVLLLIWIMTVIALVVAGISIAVLYRTALEVQKARLVEIVQNQARLLEAIARFNATHNQDYPGGPEAATLSQICDAHEHYAGFGETGEFTLARLEGDSIVFLLSHRHYDLDRPQPVPFDSDLAKPMRLALSGQLGTVVGPDYRGKTVLAAYEPVAGLDLGIVAKIDLSEIQAPFVRAGVGAASSTVVLVFLGALLFLRVTNPLLRSLEESERRSRKQLAELDHIYNTSPVGLCFLDTELRFVRLNEAMAAINGKLVAAHIGQTLEQVIPEIAPTVAPVCHRVIETGEAALNFEVHGVTPAEPGVERDWLASCYPVRSDQGVTSGVSTVVQEITRRVRAEKALKTYSEQLEEMVQARTRDLQEAQQQLVRREKLAVLGQLAGGVGHELRNPLGAIKNAVYFIKLVLKDPAPEVKETLEILGQEVDRSERIISDLLDFARPKPLTRRKVDLHTVVREALSRTVVPDNVKIVDQLDQAPPIILADPGQLEQVFDNLILNAIQAMPGGGRLTIKAETENEDWVSVSFCDDGVGISEENLRKIFEPLFTTKAKGIGLGLALVKTLVEAHGGAVEVQSEAGKGSNFVVRLPLNTKGRP
jgi:PAS domain S-box-containing protein